MKQHDGPHMHHGDSPCYVQVGGVACGDNGEMPWNVCNVWAFRETPEGWIVEQQRFNTEAGEVVAGTGVWCATVATESLARRVAEMLADDDS